MSPASPARRRPRPTLGTMPSPHARAARIAGGALAGAIALAGCSLSSDNVSCSGTTCTATLSGDAASAEILGTTLEFGGTKDGRATLGVGDANVSDQTTLSRRVACGRWSSTWASTLPGRDHCLFVSQTPTPNPPPPTRHPSPVTRHPSPVTTHNP